MRACKFARDLDEAQGNGHQIDTGRPSRAVAEQLRALGYTTGRASVTDHRRGSCSCKTERQDTAGNTPAGEYETHKPDGSADYCRFSNRPWGYEDFREFIRETGQDPDDVTFAWGFTSHPSGHGFWNKLLNVRPKAAKDGGAPAWPVIQPAAPAVIHFAHQPTRPSRDGLKLAMKCADTQIGFRRLNDGTLDPFHDDEAMLVFVKACWQFQPDKIQILGDFLDLASQSRWAQEASFAQTTQAALDAGHKFLAMLRGACPTAEIVIVEGNHDKRMQNFVEANALAAFGLRKAELPESWPVMSIPNLLRLDELEIRYVDAYPAATDWDNDTTRNIHGTKVNSRGSTTAQYVAEVPHINTWAGHTHRPEITYRSTVGPRGEITEAYSANPGCLCRVDGGVPSVNGAIGADGRPAHVVENWQQGFWMAYYSDTESWPFVYRIREGRALVDGHSVVAA